jgi:transposase
MRAVLDISIKESVAELKGLQKKHPGKFKMLQMLLLLKKQGATSKNQLAVLTGASDKSVQTWRTKYVKAGLDALLQDKRGGNKTAAITPAVNEKLAARLTNPKEGFRSFIEIQQWLQKDCGVAMQYQAVNKYVKRKFGARLKVSRKSHVHKSPAAEAVFKKPVRKVGTY